MKNDSQHIIRNATSVPKTITAESMIRFMATDKSNDYGSGFWCNIKPARREIVITKTQSCGKSIGHAAMPNDQKLSHAAGDSRQPETRSEN